MREPNNPYAILYIPDAVLVHKSSYGNYILFQENFHYYSRVEIAYFPSFVEALYVVHDMADAYNEPVEMFEIIND